MYSDCADLTARAVGASIASDRMRGLFAPVLGCLTLGLAPFVPEPHIIGKLRWVIGGAHGMSGVDWFDLLFHGAPWVWLLGAFIQRVREGEPSTERKRRALIVAAAIGAIACTLWALLGQ